MSFSQILVRGAEYIEPGPFYDMNRLIATTILICMQVTACAYAIEEKLISREIAIGVANDRLKGIAACIDSSMKVEALLFLTGKELNAKFSVRGKVPDAEKVDLERPYWSVIITYKLLDGRKMSIGTTVDAISGAAVEGKAQYAPSLCGK